jgi:class 3 adenylate cyclase
MRLRRRPTFSALQAETWGDLVVRVRMGLHTGTATFRADGHYEGYLALAHVQRVMSLAYGGQILLSQSISDLDSDALRDGDRQPIGAGFHIGLDGRNAASFKLYLPLVVR